MKNILEIISRLLDPTCLLENRSAQTLVNIKENDPSASLKHIIISGLTPGMIIFFPDKVTKHKGKAGKYKNYMSSLLAKDGRSPHNRSCDAVIMIFNDNSYDCEIIYIELKSGDKGSIAQFKSTKCFIEYLKAILKEFHEIVMSIKKSRYIVFTRRPSIHKVPSRPEIDQTGSIPNNPKNFRVNNGDTISIQSLLD